LEWKRNCGFLRLKGSVPRAAVWASGNLLLEECPKPYISGESLGIIEQYLVWRKFGGSPVERRPAKEVDGFLTLDAEIAEEERDALRRLNHGHIS
jgi:hypothetical protein